MRSKKKQKKRMQEFYNITYRFKAFLTSLQYIDKGVNKLTLRSLKNKMTSIINCLIVKNCQIDGGVLLKQMLKLEADLAIAGHLMHLEKSTIYRINIGSLRQLS